MTLIETISLCSGVGSLLGTLYTLMKVGFRVEELWKIKEKTENHVTRITMCETKIDDLHTYLWHRGEREAISKRAIHKVNNNKDNE